MYKDWKGVVGDVGWIRVASRLWEGEGNGGAV